jgi:RNA polymerase sigma factor (sigma-70 family)
MNHRMQTPKKRTNIGIEKKRILTAIQELPEMQSQAIALKYFSELKNQEIAQVLEKSETAVRILQSRGLKKLRELLEEK